jgi:hypothetical protein
MTFGSKDTPGPSFLTRTLVRDIVCGWETLGLKKTCRFIYFTVSMISVVFSCIALIIAFLVASNLKPNERDVIQPMSAEVAKTLYKMLKETHDIFTIHELQYFITSGSLLGSVRHAGLIPWDDDADVGILSKDEDQFVSLRPIFLDYGYEITNAFFGFKISPLIGTLKPKGGLHPSLDVFVYKEEGDKVILDRETAHSSWPNEWFRKTDLYNLKLYNFANFKLFGPRNPFPYLQQTYGDQWMTFAVTGLNHFTEEEFPTQSMELSFDDRAPAFPFQ